ncbi:respiratory nitrate reductase 1 subunit delta [Escherichia coli]|nr:respiratory nitrate reductase 1 subunit delta [Escherichia coli]
MIELVIVSRLLEYPDAALWQHQQEMFEAIAASKNLSKEDAHALGIFLRDLTAMDPLDAQAQYSELFDRGRATSLLLFEHVHGESRDRGQAMVDLLAVRAARFAVKQPRITGPSAAVSGVPVAAAAKRSRGRFERYRADSGIAERASATA